MLTTVVMEHGDLIAEEPRRPGAGMRDQRLVLRQFQLQVIAQERREPPFDLLNLGSGPGEPEQGVVGVRQ